MYKLFYDYFIRLYRDLSRVIRYNGKSYSLYGEIKRISRAIGCEKSELFAIRIKVIRFTEK